VGSETLKELDSESLATVTASLNTESEYQVPNFIAISSFFLIFISNSSWQIPMDGKSTKQL
jgi:hypothetical protein